MVEWICGLVSSWGCRCFGRGAVMLCDTMPVAGNVVACGFWVGLVSMVGTVLFIYFFPVTPVVARI